MGDPRCTDVLLMFRNPESGHEKNPFGHRVTVVAGANGIHVFCFPGAADGYPRGCPPPFPLINISPSRSSPARRPCLGFGAEPPLAPRGTDFGALVVPVSGNVINAHAAVVADVSLDTAPATAGSAVPCHAADDTGHVLAGVPGSAREALASPPIPGRHEVAAPDPQPCCFRRGCQWRSKRGPPWRSKKGPLGSCGLVPVVHGRAPRATRRALNRLTRRRAREGPVGPRGQAWAGWAVQKPTAATP